MIPGHLALPLRALLERPEVERTFGPFQLLRQLGRGAFAPVWLAREVYGDLEVRRVAIKLFALDPERDPVRGGSSRERILGEARLLERLEHPNIVRFLFTLSDEERRLMGIVMEYVEGASLERRLARGPMPLDEVLDLGARVASALSAVHRAGLVHRDVKPANIIANPGATKLIDFGIATRHRDREGAAGASPRREAEDVGRTGARRVSLVDLPAETLGADLSVLGDSVSITVEAAPFGLPSGTVGYIDPACIAEGLPATPASDIYSLGATLFQCLAGKLPAVVAAGAGGGMRGEVLDGRAPPPRLVEVVPEVPASIGALIDAMLAPARERRPPSAEEIAVALTRARRERSGVPRRLPAEDAGPFRMGAYDRGDRDVFFGRSAEAATVIEMLRSRGLVCVAGAAGSGKTSLLRAGLVPMIEEGGLGDWVEGWDARLVDLDPARGARAAVAAALEDVVPGAAGRSADEIALALAARVEATRRGTLLVVDRLEDLLGDPDAVWAADLIARVADAPSPGVRVLVAVRRERLDALLSVGGLGRALPRGLLLLPDLDAAALREAIREALAAYGYRFEDEALAGELAAALARRETRGAAQQGLAAMWAARDRAARLVRRGEVKVGIASVPAPAPAPAPLAAPAVRMLAEAPRGEPAPAAEALASPSSVAPAARRGGRFGAALAVFAAAAALVVAALLLPRSDRPSAQGRGTAVAEGGGGLVQPASPPPPIAGPTPAAPPETASARGSSDEGRAMAEQNARLRAELAALRQRVRGARSLADLERLQRELERAAPGPQPPENPAY